MEYDTLYFKAEFSERKIYLGRAVHRGVKITGVCAKFDFSFESLTISLILFVFNLMMAALKRMSKLSVELLLNSRRINPD